MISAAFIVVDFFFLYSTISLIGVFFPAEVCNSLILHYSVFEYIHICMQAGNKAASVFVTGVIIGVTSLVVIVLAPIVGYLVTIYYSQ